MGTAFSNVYQAWRAWTASLKRGGATLPVILTLALAIGATTAMFVLVKRLLSVLPYQHSEELVMLWESVKPSGPKALRLSIPDYQDFAAQNQSFAHMALFAPGSHNLLVGESTERISAPDIGTGFFAVLGVRMLKGRDATPSDVSVALLSENLWRSRFPGWDDPIGKIVRVDGINRQVIGIVPKGQEFPPTAEMWMPFVPSVETCNCKRNGHSYQVIGRLKNRTSVPQADSEVQGIAARLALQYPDSNTNTTAWVQPLRDKLIGDVKPAMWMLAIATTSLLLMGCVSVATILFARGAYRASEIAMRQVLGATRGRILMQLLLESSFSAIVAAGVGLFIAWWILHLFLNIVPESLPSVQIASIDLRAIGFALLVAMFTVIIFSLAPALYSTRTSLFLSVREGALPNALSSSQRVRNGLVFVETTVSFALLAVSVLLLNSLLRLTNVDPGFTQQGVISADLSLNPERYSSPQQVALFYENLLEHLKGRAEVESAAVVDSLPMTGSTEGAPYYPVGTFQGRPGEEPIARVTFVTPGYFKTMNMPMLRGRDFNTTDGDQTHVMIISEGIAHATWPHENPIGKRIGLRGAGSLSWEVIGLVNDIKDDGLAAASPSRLYLNEQEFGEKDMTVVVRTAGDLRGVTAMLKHEVSSLDPATPVYNIKPLTAIVNESLMRNQTVTRIVGAFSIMALILSAVGVYGVILSNLVRRTKEFGIRIAIGSRLSHIAWLVMRDGILLVLLGMAAGLALAFISSRSLSSFLFGVTKVDLPSYVTAAGAQLLVVCFGCLALLRRITRLDPVIALKNG